MIRDADTVYINGARSERLQKEYSSDYQKEVKRELNDTRDGLIYARRRGDVEMADNPSHKKLKPSVKKYSYDVLYKMVFDYIKDKAQDNHFSITKEDIAISLKCRVKDLDKIFMQLNREGILSQAEHRFMHDSMRNPNEETISSDYVRCSDWASDIYRICDTKLISQSEEDVELE